jgi:hypothetical protein
VDFRTVESDSSDGIIDFRLKHWNERVLECRQ